MYEESLADQGEILPHLVMADPARFIGARYANSVGDPSVDERTAARGPLPSIEEYRRDRLIRASRADWAHVRARPARP
jgi:hypothetical protein